MGIGEAFEFEKTGRIDPEPGRVAPTIKCEHEWKLWDFDPEPPRYPLHKCERCGEVKMVK